MKQIKNTRSYPIKTFQNKKKHNCILDLYTEYKKFYSQMINIQYRLYQKTGYLNKYIDIKEIPSKLSERYKRCVTQQVIGQMQSWLSNKNNKITNIIHQCDKSRNGFVSPNSRAIFLDFNHLTFESYYESLKSRNKLKTPKSSL